MVLLIEAARLQREQVQALVDDTNSAIARTKKLCNQSARLLRDGKPKPRQSKSA